MSSTNGDADDLDPETEAAVRRAVREEIRAAVRAVSQIGGGLLFGFLVLPALAGVLLVLDVPITIVFLLWVGALLGLGAYAWDLSPFR
ncbi:hypothetical protein [Halolamina sediminis]|jgi:hypothetical protein|uniref:hypothetical protein n=1 Tax=Halolamina sediminis TaxID=1480675 RepID=UPI0006B535CA|nr:hypothetical protein [Halolamina sediminis]